MKQAFLIFIFNFNKIKKFIVLYVFFLLTSYSSAGSFEDFFQAVQQDEVQVISNLLNRGFDPNTLNLQGEPALFLAWKKESFKALNILIKHPKTNVNVFNEHSESILMLACLKGNLALAEALIARDADINQPGWTALHYAASSGHSQIVKLLLENSAYIDAESPNGTTPLMMAARYGNLETVKLLVNEGADLIHKNKLGLSALDFAKDGASQDSFKLLEAALTQIGTKGAIQ